MICPNCGNQNKGAVCAACGTRVKSKKKTGLLITAILLALIIAACVVLLFVLPGVQSVADSAKNYATAAYYTNRLVNQQGNYSAYKDFKLDIDRAIEACDAVSGSAFSFLAGADIDFSLVRTAYAMDVMGDLDTDMDSGYDGGYTGGAKRDIEAFMGGMKEDAQIAKEVLMRIDDSVDERTSGDVLAEVLDTAAYHLQKADNVKVVVGDKQMSMFGVSDIGTINFAVKGADAVIDGDVLYLGKNGGVAAAADDLGSSIVLVSSGNAVRMVTDEVRDSLGANLRVMIDYSTIGVPPMAASFDDQEEFAGYLPDDVAEYLGFQFDEADEAAGSGAQGDVFEQIDTDADTGDDGIFPDTADADIGDEDPADGAVPADTPQPTPESPEQDEDAPSKLIMDMVGVWELYQPADYNNFTTGPGYERGELLKIMSDGTGTTRTLSEAGELDTVYSGGNLELVDRDGGVDIKYPINTGGYFTFSLWIGENGYLYMVDHETSNAIWAVGVRIK